MRKPWELGPGEVAGPGLDVYRDAVYRVHPAGYAESEDDIHAAYDGETPQVAVEVFDHQLADVDPQSPDDFPIARGAWFVGEEAAVMAALKAEKLDDWEVQYELRPVDDDGHPR